VATDRKAEYFHSPVGTNNGLKAAWLNVSVTGAVTSVSGHLYVAQEPEHFQHDADGNLTSDGRWTYTWDAENRLIGMTVNTSAGPQYQLTFAYDTKGRRIQKTVANNGVTSTTTFLYDGWNLIAELGANNAPIRNYVWGTDLSGSAQDAGGVGGLLEVTYHGTATTNAFVAYDGNGNVSALVNAGDGTLLAGYEYGPFGEVIRQTGPMATANPFRFSTKYDDDESDLLYYGYRYYKPSTGTWPNRDPIQELGFANNNQMEVSAEENGEGNLYRFVDNDSIDFGDDFGLALYAIDGTWTTAADISNPWLLIHWTKESPARYFRGPRDGPTGIDTFPIALNVYHTICADYCAAGGENFTVNLTGWSRGAVAAVEVAQLLNDLGCNCGCGIKKPIPVNWIGLFDAVNMTIVQPPGAVPPNVAHFYHAVKTSTSQWYFPTYHFSGGIEHKVYNYDPPIPSTHSDVGESVAKGGINDAYPWIEGSAIASGVKF
jgi:RHS repeat-associated protein